MNGDVSCRVLVFAKAPIAGQVKTRLIPLLGEDGARMLYERLADHTVHVAVSGKVGHVELWCSPHSNHPFFAKCASQYAIRLREQAGADLGARLYTAAAETPESTVLIVGCDCPVLCVDDFTEARVALEKSADAVLGPAQDGGYYLLGFRRSDYRLFKDIDWGTDKVLEQTRERLRGLKWAWHELQTKWDIDVPEDYRRFISEGVLLRGEVFLS